MMRHAVFVGGCLVLVTRAVLAQEAALLVRGDPDASAQVSRIVETTAAAGLPTDPILSKVQLGNIRRVPASRIVAAASALASRLEDARVALAPNPTERDIKAGADALGFGATTESLKTIRRVCVSRRRPVAGALDLLAQLLTTKKVVLDSATKAVTDLIERGATDAQLVALGNDVNADIAGGSQAVAALETRVEGLAAVLSPPGSGFGFGGDKVTAPSVAGGSLSGSTRDNPTPPPRRP